LSDAYIVFFELKQRVKAVPSRVRQANQPYFISRIEKQEEASLRPGIAAEEEREERSNEKTSRHE
jgi:hypothetical protein